MAEWSIMQIHIVKAGDTMASIANQYGVSAERIIIENELPNPDNLLVGQSIGIRTPNTVYTVAAGDTVFGIAQRYGVEPNLIYQNNPQVAGRQGLVPGEVIVITYANEEKIDTVVTNGYAYPFIDRAVLRKTLPFLTYLSLFTYGFTPTGELVPIEDTELIAIAKEFGVAPIMVLAPMDAQGNFSSESAHAMFTNAEAQTNLINNLVTALQAKGYAGIDIDFEFILPEDRQLFINFVSAVNTALNNIGLITLVALAPKTSGEMKGLLYEAHDYEAIGAIADEVLLMTYE